MSAVKYLTDVQVIFLNAHQIVRYTPNEQKGLKDHGLLDSALNRPKQSAFGDEAYPTMYGKAAALFESLAKNHCFHNANKRTAFASLYMFLRQNGYKMNASPKEAEDFTVAMVENKEKIDFEEICSWIELNSFKV